MVNNYKRKTSQASWDENLMARAIKEINDKRGSVKSIELKYNIPRTTLRRHIATGSAKKKLGRYKAVFTPQQEEELLEYVFHMDNIFFGLTKEDFLHLIFQYAEANNIPNPFKNGTAGHDFYKGFIKRHPNLTLRRPEPTSIARARGFNRSQVYRFFDLLETEIEKHQIDAMRLYNMDETGIQTSSNKPPRVLTTLGKKQVGFIASTERGRTTTVICCCNAAGSFLPPLMIFARKRMAPNLLDGAPPGTQAIVSDNGWTNGTVFLDWLRFFIDTVRPTAEKKVLLIMDNHESHKYLPALEFASKCHVIFVSLAPHTTHRMQPLDLCVYGPLKTYFERSVAIFQKTYVGRIINQKYVARLFGTAYLRAATTQNAKQLFVQNHHSMLLEDDQNSHDFALPSRCRMLWYKNYN
ncbi:MFS-type transporter clz9-like [Papilio machaon]|uniref:MFS-type transporter clz9-like n=1 Tax=Papilio machaon TaxID=76193 RepID=UPI001E6659F9|nr:MFS-type transporter clz9-like [Papilio machaon]